MDPIAALRQALDPLGLALRGGFHPTEEDAVPDCVENRKTATLLLVGNLGRALWPVFSRSPEMQDGAPHALDRWTRRVLERIAAELGATALFPFGGPPWLPFQRWAVRAGSVAVSPLRILIDPDYGLWQAYRGALAFAERLALPEADRRPRPCDSCAEQPCLSACPVGAFAPQGYDAARCRQHVASAAGRECREGGCLARRACPVGREHAYEPAQMAFHMRAFLAGPPGT